MQFVFDKETYTSRRQRLASAIPNDIIVIAGNKNSPFNYADNYYPFRQDSSFLYFAGIDRPGLNLVIDCDSGRSILFGDEVDLSHTVWMGPQPSLRDLADLAGIDEVRPSSRIHDVCDGRTVHCLPPYRAEHFRLYQDITDRADCSASPSQKLIGAVVAQREVKSSEEVEQIEEALEVTARMHVKVMEAARPGMSEANLAGIALGIAEAHDCLLAYGMILSRDGHILHNHAHYNVLKEGDLILCDYGAENRMHYASDITRTFPVSEKFTSVQRDIYEIVLKAEQECIRSVGPGKKYLDIHLQAARIITEGLQAMGLMRGNAEESVAAGAHALFFPHGLGHMIGLDVHDMEGLGEDLVGYSSEVSRSEQFGTSALRLGKELTAGHVLTVEPGIYFIPALIDQWKKDNINGEFIDFESVNKLRDFTGIRIEDDVLVTAEGSRVLGPRIPRTIEEIESLRSR